MHVRAAKIGMPGLLRIHSPLKIFGPDLVTPLRYCNNISASSLDYLKSSPVRCPAQLGGISTLPCLSLNSIPTKHLGRLLALA